MKKLLRSSISSLFYQGTRLFGAENKGLRILCYHKVNDEEKNYLTVPVSSFQNQMDFLAREGYQTLSLNDLLSGKENIKGVVITFDDGYEDNFLNAYPIMKKYGFKGTIFCVADQIGKKPYLNLDQIREMRTAGFEFGSHTVSHVNLRKADSDTKWREISDSKEKLEALFHEEVHFFCYPFGEYDPEAVHLVSEAGYKAAVSNIPGANRGLTPPKGTDPSKGDRSLFNAYLLKRTEIGAEDTVEDFRKKLAGAYDLLHRALHQMRGRP
jgi:peptidoglycan/xylan/chitin deacetylase (PgdA/CDA1 family)